MSLFEATSIRYCCLGGLLWTLSASGLAAADLLPLSLARPEATVTAAAGSSLGPMTPEGRFLVINSEASNLVAEQDDTNGSTDAFLLDRQLATTTLLSHRPGEPARTNPTGGFAHELSPDGRRVLLSYGPSDGLDRRYGLLDITTDTFTVLPPGLEPAGTGEARLWSADGRFLVLAERAGTARDLVLFDTQLASTLLVTHLADKPNTRATGVHRAIALTPDGRYLLFVSTSAQLVKDQIDANGADDAFLFDRLAGTSELLTAAAAQPLVALGGTAWGLANNGRWIALTGLPALGGFKGHETQTFLFDRVLRQMRLVSRAADDPVRPGDGASTGVLLSPNGRFVLFASTATNLVSGQLDDNEAPDVFLFDRVVGVSSLVSRVEGSPGRTGNGGSLPRGVSPDGRFSIFASTATDLVSGIDDPTTTGDLFRFDRFAQHMELISHAVDDAFRTGNFGVGSSRISLDSRTVVFESRADDLAGGSDRNGREDCFAWTDGPVELLTVAKFPVRTTSAGGAGPFRMTPDGRLIAFTTYAHDLLDGDDGTGLLPDALLYHRDSGLLEHLGSGTVADIEPDGERVLLTTRLGLPGAAPDVLSNVLVVDRTAGGTTVVSHAAGDPALSADGSSEALALSADGRFVLFSSEATNLVAGQVDSPGTPDLFLYDRETAQATLVSHAAGSAVRTANAPSGASSRRSLTPDGRFVVFASSATDLVAAADSPNGSNAFLFDRSHGHVELVSHVSQDPGERLPGRSTARALSDDGRWVAFENQVDPSAPWQILLLDRTTGETRRVTRDFDGDGRPASRPSSVVAMTPDGRHLLIDSEAQLLADVTLSRTNQVYVYDRLLDRFELISHRWGSPRKNSDSWAFGLDLSPDGQFVVFEGLGSDLTAVPATFPGADDYLYDRALQRAILLSHRPTEPGADSNARDPFLVAGAAAISEDGTTVAFLSRADNLYPHDFNFMVLDPGEDGRLPDLFLHREAVASAKP